MWLFDSLEAGSLECFDPRRIEIAARSEHTGDCQHSVVLVFISHLEWMLAIHVCDPVQSIPWLDVASAQKMEIDACSFRHDEDFICFFAVKLLVRSSAPWLSCHDAFLASKKQGPHSWPSMYPFQ